MPRVEAKVCLLFGRTVALGGLGKLKDRVYFEEFAPSPPLQVTDGNRHGINDLARGVMAF